jgi:Zn-dependent protease with chaperone function
MSFLLMVFLTVVCVVGDFPATPLWQAPGWSVLAAALAVGLVGLHAFWVSWRVWRPLARDPGLRERVLARYERRRFYHQTGQIALFIILLWGLGWGWTVGHFWGAGDREFPGPALPGAELVLLLPFVLGQVVSWLCFYDADRAVHRAAHRLVDADAFGQSWVEAHQAQAVPFDGRWGYLAFQLRQKLALVFIPVLLLIVQKELLRLVPPNWQERSVITLLGLTGLAGVFVGMPLLIRLVLGLRPLPEGPLRDRLLAASRRLHFRATDILLWNTRSGMANAMVIGLLPWLRFVVFTDRLLDEFSEDEVEAVFGHEVGHVRHRHMLYYLLFLTASLAVLGLVFEHYLKPSFGYLLGLASQGGEATQAPSDNLLIFPAVGLLLAYVFVVFGFLSRRCERQADVFGCRAVSCNTPGCRDHDAATPLAARGKGLCLTGIRTFIRALEKVALVNGINRERPGFLQSWQHSTIARRVAFLDRVLIDQAVEARFQRRLWLLKWALLLSLAAAAAALWCLNR